MGDIGNIPVSSSSGGGGSSSSSSVADWTLSSLVFRYYYLDADGGSDSNVGYSDVSPADALTKAVATAAKLRSILPAHGNDRNLAIFIKPRASGVSYTEVLDLRNLLGYHYRLIRASHDGANTALEKIICGGVDWTTGSTSPTVWTVASASHALQWTVTGTLPAANSLRGARIRWLPGSSFGTMCQSVYANTAGAGGTIQAKKWYSPGNAPVPGDQFVLERPGAVFQNILIDGPTAENEFSGGSMAGLTSTNVFHDGFQVVGGYWAMSFMDIGGTYHRDSQGSVIDDNYYDEGQVPVVTGTGAIIRGDYQFFHVRHVYHRVMDFLGTGTIHGYQNCDRFVIGENASTFAQPPRINGSGFAPLSVPTAIFNQFGAAAGNTGPGPAFPVLVYGPPTGLNPCIDGVNCSVKNIDFTNQGTRGVEIVNHGGAITISNCSGTTGNTGPGLDISLCRSASIFFEGTNTVSGTSGDLKTPSGALVALSSFAKVGYTEEAGGNQLTGSAGLTSGAPAVAVTNKQGGGVAMNVGEAVFVSGTSQVQKGNAVAAGTAHVDGFMVSSPADNALGLMVPVAGAPYALCQAAPAAAAQMNLSAVTAGTLTSATPAIVVAVGRALDADGAKTAIRVLTNNK